MTTESIARRTCTAADGVTLVYSVAGAGDPALLFIHGGLANRGFWDGELRAFAGRHKVIALDLPGHGESGSNRREWGMPAFGGDVRAVADAEGVGSVVLFGNSLGGPVAIEAALQMPGRAIAVVGVDTFQTLAETFSPEDVRKRAEAFRDDYEGALAEMTKLLFHPDTDPALVADARRRMSHASREAMYAMFMSLGGYDMAAPARRLTVPIRAINGDLYPTDVEGNRAVKADFEVVTMAHVGHYPMLERPAEFDRIVEALVKGLLK